MVRLVRVNSKLLTGEAESGSAEYLCEITSLHATSSRILFLANSKSKVFNNEVFSAVRAFNTI